MSWSAGHERGQENPVRAGEEGLAREGWGWEGNGASEACTQRRALKEEEEAHFHVGSMTLLAVQEQRTCAETVGRSRVSRSLGLSEGLGGSMPSALET